MAAKNDALSMSSGELDLAVQLLRKNSSLNAVSAFLKDRELNYSATSWEMMRNDRLRPALDRGDLDRTDLLTLLRESEEYGRQRIFLYRCPSAEAALLTYEPSLRDRLRKMDLLDLLDRPRIVGVPAGLQVVEVRLETDNVSTNLVVKFVDVRKYMTQLDRTMEGDVQVVRSREQRDRAVNVFRLSSSGLAELCIQTHKNALDYAAQAEAVFNKLAGITDRLLYQDCSLTKARRYLLENRLQLSNSIRFGAGTVRTKKGAPVTFATSDWKANLFGSEDVEVEATMSTLLAAGKGRSHCDVVNCTWLREAELNPLGIEVHTLIGGKTNELQIPTQCGRTDYLYVLGKIVSFTR